jgi:hypothetical protein
MNLNLPTPLSERRVEIRQAVRAHLSFKYNGMEHSGDAVDLGFGGVGIKTDVEIPDGARLEMTLGIPFESGQVFVTVRGTVRWSLASMSGVWRYGVGFEALRGEQRQVLQRYLSQ